MNTWWIDSSATMHVSNSLQGFIMYHQRAKGRKLKVANEEEAAVEALSSISLALNNDFILRLNNVDYVPFLRRNLISVSELDDDNFV